MKFVGSCLSNCGLTRSGCSGRFRPSPAILLVGILFWTGCGGAPATHVVKGRVVYSDGTPVEFGDIETLAGEPRVNARGKIKKDGSFTLTTFQENDGAVAGEHKVIIMQTATSPLAALGKLPPIEHAHGHDMDAKYRSYDSSGLSFQVEAGVENEVTLVIDKFTPGKSSEVNNSDPSGVSDPAGR